MTDFTEHRAPPSPAAHPLYRSTEIPPYDYCARSTQRNGSGRAKRTGTATAQNWYVRGRPKHATLANIKLCKDLLFSLACQTATIKGVIMINSLVRMILGGCAHKRTTFPLTPSRTSKLHEGARRGTYVVCLNCGKEFEYDWKEMCIGSPFEEIRVSPSALQAEQNSRTLNEEGEPSERTDLPSPLTTRMPDSAKKAVVMHQKTVQLTEVIQERPWTRPRGHRLRCSKPADRFHRSRLPARTA